nr:RNA-directed DNA polymerase, eukaryota, reverse transcriptase zinc-binding domain protein [Tanacetum cinerariifolium]
MWGFLLYSFKGNLGNYSNSFSSVLKSGKPVTETTGREVPSLVFDDTCFSDMDFNLNLMGKVKDITALPNLYVILEEEGFQNFKIFYLGRMCVLIELESSTTSQKFIKHAGVGSWFSFLQPASNSFVSDERIMRISIEGLPLKVWSFNTSVKTKLNKIICERFKVIIQGNVHWVRAKEMERWDSLLRNEDYASLSSDEENEQENEGSRDGEKYESNKEVNKVSESSCMQGDALFYDNDKNKKRDGNSKEGELKYPLGFTPKETSVNEVHEKEMEAPSEEVKQNSYNSVRNNSLNASYCSQRFKAGGSIIDLMDELVKIEGFDKLVEDSWMHMDIIDSNGMILLKKKLQAVKIIIREWTKNAKKCSYKKKSSIQSKLFDIDKIIDQGGSNEVILNARSILLKELHDIIYLDLEEMAQKEKVRWAIEGDENSNFRWTNKTILNELFLSKKSNERCGIVAQINPLVLMVLHLNSFEDIGKSLRMIFQLLSWSSSLQSPFISNRQILDGLFILNELLSWYKYNKLKAMVFKVDFEKAFDSIRCDYLDDLLKSFGLGDKWRGWISGCLKSAKGSVLVNGCPTSEFQFHRGLKQGDPLSPFLFILIMESLHLSLKKVMKAGLFTGISLDNSLTISHLFYADDSIFVGKWDSSNLMIILKVLKCFHMAEFWCTAIPYKPNPSDDEAKPRPLKEFLIEFSVMNGKKPLTLDFATFVTSTGLDYNKEIQDYFDKKDKIKKAKKQTRLLTITKPKVIKVVQEEAEKIGVVPKKISSAKTGEEFKKVQDAKHPVLKIKHSKKVKRLTDEEYMWTMKNRIKPEPITDVKIHPNTKPVVLSVYMNNDKRNFNVHNLFKLKEFLRNLEFNMLFPISKQAPSQTSGRKRKHMELEPEVKLPRLECDMSHPEGVSFVNNMVIKEPKYRIFFIDVFGDQAFQR